MTNQDKRAVESMIRCGLNLDVVIDNFPSLDQKEVEDVYWDIVKVRESVVEVPVLKMNCS